MGLLEQKLLGWIATKSVKNSAGSLKILRVQNVMSWRSAGLWTRCTRSNAFPATNFAVWKMKLLTQHDQIERLREFYLNIPVELNSDFTSIQNKQKKVSREFWFHSTENIKLFILIGHDLTEDGFDCNM